MQRVKLVEDEGGSTQKQPMTRWGGEKKNRGNGGKDRGRVMELVDGTRRGERRTTFQAGGKKPNTKGIGVTVWRPLASREKKGTGGGTVAFLWGHSNFVTTSLIGGLGNPGH